MLQRFASPSSFWRSALFVIAALLPCSFALAQATIQNAYIRLTVLESGKIGLYTTGGRDGGDPQQTSDDDKNLLYGSGSTGGLALKIGNEVTALNAPSSGPTVVHTESGDVIKVVWEVEDITVEATYSLVSVVTTGPDAGKPFSVKMQFDVRNTGNNTATVGLKVGLDVQIGDNDHARIFDDEEYVEVETCFGPGYARNVPPFWQAHEYDSVDEPGVIARGVLIGLEAVKPDKFAIGQWPALSDDSASRFDYECTGQSYGDSATAVWWLDRALAAGASVRFVTYYGLGSTEIVAPEIRPDLMIKKESEPDSSYAISNVFQSTPSGDQVEEQSVPSGITAWYRVKLENKAARGMAAFAVKADGASDSGWSVVFKRLNGQDFPSSITTTKTTIGMLMHGASEIIRVGVTPRAGVFGLRSKDVVINVYGSLGDPIVRDAVKMTTKVIPDIRATLSIKPNPGVVGGLLTARIAVTRSAYSDGFRIDFYRNLDIEPLEGQRGDNVMQVPAGTSGVTREIQFRMTEEGTFHAWAKMDSLNQIAEVSETNNLASATYVIGGLSITGSVRNEAGQGIANAAVSAMSPSDPRTVRTALTNASGQYTITGVRPGRYIVSAVRPGYVFSPPLYSLTLTSVSPHATGINFIGSGIDISASLQIVPSTSQLGKMLTAIITVTRSGATQRGFWVDLYTHLSSPPASKRPGALYFFVPAGSGNYVKRVTFTPKTTGTFTAWIQVDTDGFVVEADETNNIVGPVQYVVLPSVGGSSIEINEVYATTQSVKGESE